MADKYYAKIHLFYTTLGHEVVGMVLFPMDTLPIYHQSNHRTYNHLSVKLVIKLALLVDKCYARNRLSCTILDHEEVGMVLYPLDT